MAFSVHSADQTVIIKLSGKFLGSIDGPGFKDEIEKVKGSGKKRVIVDLAKADFLDSTAIGLLIGALTSMRNADGDMKLCGMKARVKNIFLLTRLLGPVFVEHDSIEEAQQAFE